MLRRSIILQKEDVIKCFAERKKSDEEKSINSLCGDYTWVILRNSSNGGNNRFSRRNRQPYGFNGIGSLEEYFAYDPDEYYASLQMGLPALYYSGRENPPHPEIWINYFLRMMELYSKKVYELSKTSENDELDGSLSSLNAKEKEFLAFLLKKRLYEFTPIEVSKMIGVTNKTVINRCAKLVNNGLLIPIIVKTRVRSYRLSDFSKTNEKKILKKIS